MQNRLSADKRKIGLAGGLALLLTFLQVSGWQRSMKYGTSVHSSLFFQKIGVLETWQCILVGAVEWIALGVLFYNLFLFLENHCNVQGECTVKTARFVWGVSFGVLFAVYIICLIGCFPGFYNYDGATQLVQVMYKEVPYNTHHPLLHTLIEGGIITLGYRIYSMDLSLGIFLYCLFQMCVCAVSFSYSVRFVYRYTCKRFWVALAVVFYSVCPPVVMFAMSTTKDTLCYAALLPAALKLYDIYRADMVNGTITRKDWVITAVLLVLSCLMRNNIVYAIAALAVFSVVFYKRNPQGECFLYISVVVLYFIINNGLIIALDAGKGSVAEALSVPCQQIARLYVEEGEEVFDSEEQELLYAAIEPEVLLTYDPVISDPIKYAFGKHWDAIRGNRWEYVALWMRKGLQYPQIYWDSFLDNTYQAWYPGTVTKDRGGYRYFHITDWSEEYGSPKLPWLYNYYKSIEEECSYQKYPVIRLLFSIGTMLWTLVIAWVWGLWRKDRGISRAFLLILLVCVTCFLGPVSEVRYYLILFYLFPVCLGLIFGRLQRNKIADLSE